MEVPSPTPTRYPLRETPARSSSLLSAAVEVPSPTPTRYPLRETPARSSSLLSAAVEVPSPTPTRYPLRETPARSSSLLSAAVEVPSPTPTRYSLRETPARSSSLLSAAVEVPSPTPTRYPLRETPARSTPKTIPPKTPLSVVAEQQPRRYPSRVRVSAVQNLPTKESSKKRSREEEEVETQSNEVSRKKRSREEEEEKEVETQSDEVSRKKIKQILHEFRTLYENLSAKDVSGKHSRFDLKAHNIMKSENKILSRIVGSVPGLEVGDEFYFRVELHLLGLHCVLQADIDYVRKDDGKLVAVSIVSTRSEQFNTNASDSQVLVCCGSGSKVRDQKMERGNLAMKNCIEEKTPVRVTHGFRVSKEVVTYVYGGLYSVEKYWKKKGDRGRYVILFQLRRLPGQVKLNVTAFEKIPGSKSCTRKKPIIDDKKDVIFEVTPLVVRETLNEFKEIYDRLVREEESKKDEEEIKRKKNRGEQSRFDVTAFTLYKERHKGLSFESRCLGNVPGVEVGDSFHFRVELFLIGLHRMLQSNIDYIWQDGKMVAVSIVTMHPAKRKSDTLLCRGSGGHDGKDQKLRTGNLAMKNSMDAKTPVRVIHFFLDAKKSGLYIFGGLYLVEKYWKKKDEKDRYVFMFQLRRLAGEPKLDINVEQMKNLISSRSISSASACEYNEDISQGKEKMPIRGVNTIDNFVYITKVIYPPNYSLPPSGGCDCVGGCSDSDECACAVKNGGEIPFNSKGLIVEAKPLVYECGPSCKCPPTCHNRVSQQGIKFPLEVFKTESMGWGLRSQTFIPSGSFICEYIAELLEDEEATKRDTDEYLFAIGNNYYDESLWEGLSTSIPSLRKGASSEEEEDVEDGGFTLDASRYGNVGKFINHSCTPNLYAQNLLFDHDDKRMPHIMFFASEDIPPWQELTYHYNYTIDGVHDANGNVKMKKCHCGSIECTGRLY